MAASAAAAPQQLTDEQESVIRRVLLGKESIYLQGHAGTGKSYTFHSLKREAKGPCVIVGSTASTGIAGTHIQGQTVHSYLGLGDGSKSVEAQADKIMNAPFAKEQLDNCRLTCVLGLDEISMISAAEFERIDKHLRIIRRCPHLPMGGMQFLPMGDFAQLPPVITDDNEDKRLVFESPLWQQMFSPSQCVRLTRIFRQKDQEFVDLLQDMRGGALSESPCKFKHYRVGLLSDASKATLAKLDRDLPAVHGIEPTTLFSTRNEVEPFNHARLAKLPGAAEEHKAVDTVFSKDKFAFAPKNMDKLFMAPRVLPLKVGAQLMLITNLDQAKGHVNGSRCTSTVLHGDDSATVMFTDGSTRRLVPVSFEIKDRKGNVLAMRKQLPLILAWGMTIHKSQGMTLDYVSIDLSKGFAPGQAYTAISRAKNLEGLQVKGGIPLGRLLVDERVRRYERGEPPLVEQPPQKKTRKEAPSEEETEVKTSPFFPSAAAAAATERNWEPSKKART